MAPAWAPKYPKLHKTYAKITLGGFYIMMETNILGLIATALFVIIPTSFLLILFVKTEAQS